MFTIRRLWIWRKDGNMVRVEGIGSRFEGRGSRVEGRGSRVERKWNVGIEEYLFKNIVIISKIWKRYQFL
jgi:hypothetical protein